jgi:hypothetical protein
VTGQHPLTGRVYETLRGRGVMPPLPREYGLRVVSEVLRAADQIHLLEQVERAKP